MTAALLGFGTLLKVRTSTGPDVFTDVGQITKVTPYAATVNSIDATHELSPGSAKEFIPGLIDYGSGTIEIHYIPGGADEARVLGMLTAVQTCRVVFPGGAQANFAAFFSDFSPDSPLDGKMVAAVKYKITGVVTMSAAVAPVNTQLPAISGSDGSPTSGDTLTAFYGIWTGEPTSFTYQWKKDTVAIGGATNKTYLVAGGDSTHAITVSVTGTNSAGSATATSIPANIA
jgi:predicted secreted protein